MQAQLSAWGYRVLTATDSAGANEHLKDEDGIAAVLLDLRLGAEDGLKVLADIKRWHPKVPVVMVSGSHDENEARKAFDLGAWDYVTKPVDFEYLKNILLLQSGP
jgi:DNA-binding NtrC family response regulator